jgi:hypothetical protein
MGPATLPPACQGEVPVLFGRRLSDAWWHVLGEADLDEDMSRFWLLTTTAR